MAIAKTVIKPCVNRTIPFNILFSSKSVNEFINATPGTKNKMDVAKALCGCSPI